MSWSKTTTAELPKRPDFCVAIKFVEPKQEKCDESIY